MPREAAQGGYQMTSISVRWQDEATSVRSFRSAHSIGPALHSVRWSLDADPVRANGYHLERPRHAVMLGDRDILVEREAMVAKAIDWLVVFFANLVGKRPSAAATMDQQAMFVQIIGHEMSHTAELLYRTPSDSIQMAIPVQTRI